MSEKLTKVVPTIYKDDPIYAPCTKDELEE